MKILIIGGVAGGASAAARARRLSEDAEIIMLERGEHVSFANCGLPYHIGGVIKEREKLIVQTPQALKRRFNIEVRVRHEAVKIDRDARMVTVKDLLQGREYQESYDYLILSPGAEPVRLPIPGIDSPLVMTLRNIADMDRIKKRVDAQGAKTVLVVGGGYIGLEMAEALRERGIKTVMIELANQVMGPSDPEMAFYLHQELRAHGVDLRLGVSAKSFVADGGNVRVDLSDGGNLVCDCVVFAIGVRPEVALAKNAGLAVGERGGIAVDSSMRTTDPRIFAVGDVVEVDDFVTGTKAVIPLAGPANRQGRIAADNIFGRTSVYHKTQGTAVCKVFDLTIAMTGSSEKLLKRLKIPYEKVYIHPGHHASYYPDASPIHMKLVFDPSSGKILGAQAVGREGVEKRIDVLAVCLRAGLTVFDLEHLELCYAPPYGSAKDPVNMLGFVASNVIKGDAAICHTPDILTPAPDRVILDVRSPSEAEAGMIPGAVNIPIDDLRAGLGELSKEKEYLVHCQVGFRGYLACRILSQKGFRARNLSGGYLTYLATTGI